MCAIAETRDAEVFWGHCYEGEGAPPYWPWLQIVRSQIDQLDAESIEVAMGSGAEAIGETVPDLRFKLPNLGVPPTFDPDSARFRLIMITLRLTQPRCATERSCTASHR
jgi:hypothetical protein